MPWIYKICIRQERIQFVRMVQNNSSKRKAFSSRYLYSFRFFNFVASLVNTDTIPGQCSVTHHQVFVNQMSRLDKSETDSGCHLQDDHDQELLVSDLQSRLSEMEAELRVARDQNKCQYQSILILYNLVTQILHSKSATHNSHWTGAG